MLIDDPESIAYSIRVELLACVCSFLNRIGLKSGNLPVLRLSQYYHNQIIVGRVKLAMYR